jgi:hypothetical protein
VEWRGESEGESEGRGKVERWKDGSGEVVVSGE